MQPRVSPDGRLVAFWGLAVDSGGKEITGADRNIWIQPVMGGERIAVASGESTDWNPAWAPDGRTLYFSSDRSGTMNIWQIAVDPMTGRPRGAPIALSAPTGYAGHMSVAPDGTIAYAAHDFGTLVRSIGFDPDTGVVTGQPRDIVTGKRSWLHPDVSLDGRFLALRSIQGAGRYLWIVAVDGSGLRAVTNDPPRDRGPRWAADGSLLFYSARTGSFHVWTIQPDGSGARQLTSGLSILTTRCRLAMAAGSAVRTRTPVSSSSSTRAIGRSRLSAFRPRHRSTRSIFATGRQTGCDSPRPIHRTWSGCSTSLRRPGIASAPGAGRDGCLTAAVCSRWRARASHSSNWRPGPFAMCIKSRAARSGRPTCRRMAGRCTSPASPAKRISGRYASSVEVLPHCTGGR